MTQSKVAWWIWLLPLPMIWWSALILGGIWQPGMNVIQLLSILDPPSPIRWTNYSLRFLVGFTLFYAIVPLVINTSAKNRRMGAEHGSARWGNVHRVNNGKRDPQFTCSQYSKYPIGALCPTQHRIRAEAVLTLITDMLRAIAEYRCV